jgi:hypothetical protein
MKEFNDNFDTILEGYGQRLVKVRYPAKLKLSEKFIRAFREEYKRQTASIVTEDEDGNQVTNKGRNKRQVLKEFQKCLPFITP